MPSEIIRMVKMGLRATVEICEGMSTKRKHELYEKLSDEFLAENDGIRTVRLNTQCVYGRKKMPDDVILAEMVLQSRAPGVPRHIPIKFQIFEII